MLASRLNPDVHDNDRHSFTHPPQRQRTPDVTVRRRFIPERCRHINVVLESKPQHENNPPESRLQAALPVQQMYSRFLQGLAVSKWSSKNWLIYIRKLVVIYRIKQIKSRDFTVIASNCTGTLPYRFLDIPYNTPTVNLFFMAPDYMRFIKRLDYYLSLPLTFRDKSQYSKAEEIRTKHGLYPLGVLDDIEIHFMHYNSEADAQRKWNQRKKRINPEHLVFAFTDKDLCTPELLKEFDKLPYRNKFVFTAKPYDHLQHCITVPDFAGQSEMGDAYTNYDTLAHVNFAKLIGSRHQRITLQPTQLAEPTITPKECSSQYRSCSSEEEQNNPSLV